MYRVVPWIPAAVWAAVLFFASSQETLPVSLAGNQDKIAHFCAYLVLGFLLTRATAQLRLPVWLAVAAGFFYGFLDELHQSMVPGRSAGFDDWIADALGTLVGALLYLGIWIYRQDSGFRIRDSGDGTRLPDPVETRGRNP